MAVIQGTYTDQVAPGFPGMVANAETSNRITRTIEDAGGIAFGKAAFRGVGDHGVTGTPAANTFMGITIAHEALALLPGSTPDVFPTLSNVPLMTLGVIWVTAGASVADGDQVYVTSAGAFTNVSTSNVILPGWYFDTTAASGSLVKIAKR